MSDYSLLNDPEMKDIFESFLIETKEILEKLDSDLMKLESEPDNKDLLNDIFRSFHTIKGTSGFLGLVKLQKVTHKLEDILNKLRKGDAQLNDDIMDVILKGFDTINELLTVIENEKNEDLDTGEVITMLTGVLDKMNGEGSGVTPEAEENKSDEEPEKPEVNENQPEEKDTQQPESMPAVEEPVGDYSMLQDPEMTEIFESFIVETKEILEKLDLDLVKLESEPENKDLLNEIFRSFHTIKGTSGFLGLVKFQKVTHKLEDILNKLRKGEVVLNDEIMDGILKGYDVITELLAVVENEKNENLNTSEILGILQRILDNFEKSNSVGKTDSQEEKSSGEVAEISVQPKKKVEHKNTITLDNSSNAPADVAVAAEKPKQTAASKTPGTERKKQDAAKQNQQSSKTIEQTIRVDVERLDDLLNIISELVLGRNRLLQVNAEAMNEYEGSKIAHDLAETTRQIDLMTTELQLAVMKTRMIKIGKVFNRFPRLVRDLSKETGKEIQLIIKGAETELDKTLIEEINDPLVHLIRNSVDHGIEPPEVRKEKGKPVKGTIVLSADHEGNDIIITIEDDGKGIDPQVIAEKAVKRGLVTPEKVQEMSDKEIYNFIFSPGFSTAEKVTNVSGRGVGMDVVKTNVTKLHGIINVESEVGKGTKIIIKLPLTLAIIQGLLVEISGETIVIPLSSVIEVIRVAKEDVYLVNQTECVKLRDMVLPLSDIDNMLYGVDKSVDAKDYYFVVVVGIAEKRIGIKVDGLIGQKEIVIKTLGKYLGNIEGIAGSTIMGDGKVVMIVDVAELVNKLTGQN